MRHESLWQLALHYLRSFDAQHKPLITAAMIGLLTYCMAELFVAYVLKRNFILAQTLFAGLVVAAFYLLALSEYPAWSPAAYAGFIGIILGAVYRLWCERRMVQKSRGPAPPP